MEMMIISIDEHAPHGIGGKENVNMQPRCR
jgi:hypothetical protein